MSIFDNGNYEQLGGMGKLRSYRKTAKGTGGWDVGDQIAGKIVSIGKDKYSKPAYNIKVTGVKFKNKSDEPKIGELFTLNSTGGIEHQLGQLGGVSVGDIIGIEYNGEVDIEKGKWKGSKTHDIDVLIQRGDSAVKAVEAMEEDGSSLDLI